MSFEYNIEKQIIKIIKHLDEFLEVEKKFAEKIISIERPVQNEIRFGGDGITRNKTYYALRKFNICYDLYSLFFNSKRVVIYNLIKNFRHFQKDRNVLMQNIIHRSLIERFAYFYYMVRQVDKHKIEKYIYSKDETLTDININKLEKLLHRGLNQSKIELVGTENIDIKNEKLQEYNPKEGVMDKTALNILTPITQLDKKFKGTMNTYNYLSEFLHPNSGDLSSATIRVEDTRNEFEDLYRKRDIGFSRTTYRDTYINFLSQCWEQLLEIISDYEVTVNQVELKKYELRTYLSDRTHGWIKEFGLKKFEMRKGSKCPCGSNLRVKDCMKL